MTMEESEQLRIGSQEEIESFQSISEKTEEYLKEYEFLWH